MSITSTHLTAASLDRRIAMVAMRQEGAFSRSQAVSVGFSDSAICHRLRTCRWKRVLPGVYVLADHPRSWLQDVWVAHLAAGPASVVSHESALHVHGIHLLARHPITLTSAHGSHARLHGVFVHQIDDLQPHRVMNLTGLRVSSPPRAVVELAARHDEPTLTKVLDAAVGERRTTYSAVAACFREVLRPRKPGMEKLARVLDTRHGEFVPAQSELEHALFTAMTAAGLPEPVRQFPLPGRDVITGLVDSAFLLERVIVEADGRRWHARIDAFQRDRERDTDAARAGYLTLRFTWEQIIYEPEKVCAAIADVLKSRANFPPLPRR